MPSSADSRAATRPCGKPSTVKVTTGRVSTCGSGPSTCTPGMFASPFRKSRPMRLSWAMIAGQPISARVSIAACNATAPTTFGEPASSRSGRVGPDDVVELDEVDRAAARQEGVTSREGGARPDEHARPKGRIHLVAAPSDEVGLRGERTVRGKLGAVDSYRDLAAMGGVDDLVDRGSPSGDVRSTGDCEQPGFWGPVQFSSRHRPAVNVPSDRTRRIGLEATRDHGRRLEWCSTTEVTTTSSGRRRRR